MTVLYFEHNACQTSGTILLFKMLPEHLTATSPSCFDPDRARRPGFGVLELFKHTLSY